MLQSNHVSRVRQVVQSLFNEEPDIHVSIKGSTVLYEIAVYAPGAANVGRGASLSAALQHLKQINRIK